jgi:hypothetical protein
MKPLTLEELQNLVMLLGKIRLNDVAPPIDVVHLHSAYRKFRDVVEADMLIENSNH